MTSLFKSSKAAVSAAPAPVIPAPVIIPTQNSTAITKAQQEELMASAARTGRASTIMSQNDISKQDRMGD